MNRKKRVVTEKLQCTQCDAKWERPKLRGRKPLFCPKCAEENELLEAETVKLPKPKEDKKDVKYVYPPVSKWACPHCKDEFSVHVGLMYAPIHPCRLKRNQYMQYEQVLRTFQETLI